MRELRYNNFELTKQIERLTLDFEGNIIFHVLQTPLTAFSCIKVYGCSRMTRIWAIKNTFVKWFDEVDQPFSFDLRFTGFNTDIFVIDSENKIVSRSIYWLLRITETFTSHWFAETSRQPSIDCLLQVFVATSVMGSLFWFVIFCGVVLEMPKNTVCRIQIWKSWSVRSLVSSLFYPPE